MGEVDRRGFLRILGRREAADEKSEQREPTAKELQILELAEFTTSLMADVEAQNEEQLAEGHLHTAAYDLAYMRVTSGHIVFSVVTGASTIIQVSNVRAFDTNPPVEVTGHGSTVIAVLRAHHPADPETVTRSSSFRFPTESPLIPAIRSACNIPEPEPEAPEEEPEDAPAD